MVYNKLNSDKFLRGADAVGLGTALWEPLD